MNRRCQPAKRGRHPFTLGHRPVLFLVALLLAGCTLFGGEARATPPPATAPRVGPATAPAAPHGMPPAVTLIYRGAFAFPAGDAWTYSGHALAFYPDGDPAGPADGHPGSLFTVGHAWEQQVGAISIPAPLISADFAALPVAEVLQPLSDVTGGWLANCTYAPDCIYREVAGLAYLPANDRLAWNLRDWYNVAGYDQDSLGWSALDLSGAQGVWHIGARDGDVFHNARSSDYLFLAPAPFADQHLGGRRLIAGNQRTAGAFGGSQGPTLFASAPWNDGNPPAPGQELPATALLYYPEDLDCLGGAYDQCAFPGYRADDKWGGGAWVEAGSQSALFMFGQKGLGDNCYGTPGDTCPPSLCSDSQGWHSDPYEAQILVYDPADLAAVAGGALQPWQVLPAAVEHPGELLFNPECGVLNGVTYDAANGYVYVTESGAGPWGATAVHVWAVADVSAWAPLFLPLALGGAG